MGKFMFEVGRWTCWSSCLVFPAILVFHNFELMQVFQSLHILFVFVQFFAGWGLMAAIEKHDYDFSEFLFTLGKWTMRTACVTPFIALAVGSVYHGDVFKALFDWRIALLSIFQAVVGLVLMYFVERYQANKFINDMKRDYKEYQAQMEHESREYHDALERTLGE